MDGGMFGFLVISGNVFSRERDKVLLPDRFDKYGIV